MCDAEAYTAGTKEGDRRLRASRILRNLRAEAARACDDLSQAKLVEDCSGIFVKLNKLAPSGTLRAIPRVHDKLFRQTYFRPLQSNDKSEGQTAMGVYLQELLYNRRQVVRENPVTTVSDNMLVASRCSGADCLTESGCMT